MVPTIFLAHKSWKIWHKQLCNAARGQAQLHLDHLRDFLVLECCKIPGFLFSFPKESRDAEPSAGLGSVEPSSGWGEAAALFSASSLATMSNQIARPPPIA